MAKPISLTDAQALALARYLTRTLGVPPAETYPSQDPLMSAAQQITTAADEVLHAERARRRAM